MQLKQIGRLCTAHKSVDVKYIIDDNGYIRQFIGDGYSLYEVDDLGDSVTLDIMQTIFDAKPDERGKWAFQAETVNTHPLLEEYDPTDAPVQEIPLRLRYCGATIVPFKAKDRIMFVQSDYLRPLRDEIKQGGIAFSCRADYNAVIVKNGLFGVIAYIQTVMLPEGAAESLFEINRLMGAPSADEITADEAIDMVARAAREAKDKVIDDLVHVGQENEETENETDV